MTEKNVKNIKPLLARKYVGGVKITKNDKSKDKDEERKTSNATS